MRGFSDIAGATARAVRIAACAMLLAAAALANAQTASAPSGQPATGTGTAGHAVDHEALMKSERFRRLAAELRCLVCQNQTLEDSTAPLARDLREEVARLMSGGRDNEQIKTYLVDRYGEFVLYRPSISSRNALLWFGPFLFLIAGAIAWWRLGRRRTQAPRSAQAALQHVDELLGRDR